MYNNFNSYPPYNYNKSPDPYNHMYNYEYNQSHTNMPPCCPTPDEWFYKLQDHGPNPFVINIEKAAEYNNNFRLALWTGQHLQLTLMSINVEDDIGLEMHNNLDQFIRIEEGQGIVMMGDCEYNLDFKRNVCEDYVIFVPAGKWHNLINTGCVPIKLYSIYAPPEHPHGTVHRTKEDAEIDHHKY